MAQRDGFLHRVEQTYLQEDAVMQKLCCGHRVRVGTLFQDPDRGPVVPRRRYCDECARAGATPAPAKAPSVPRPRAKKKAAKKKPKRKHEQRTWERTRHTDECRHCHAEIVWFTWAKKWTPTPEQEPRTTCAECLARAAA